MWCGWWGSRVSTKIFEQAHIDAFKAQLDDLGRMYEAFELDADAQVDFVWDDAIKMALETQLQDKLELTGRCTVTHLQVGKKDAAGKEVPQHLLIVRHGDPLSSIAEYRAALRHG